MTDAEAAALRLRWIVTEADARLKDLQRRERIVRRVALGLA